ncbi:transcriptional regulator GcvA [Oceanibacterium hippocampi]|uniref:Glycine cleavage system transcriptional activator n=1 Tax=Oceanibacterium hippocampi TaxID=745714 RepID=A0A1Y5TRW2_9PROT|nr:transcriptional regulator GcvA [Oceanibacterium hippocampi]SLN66580.1 Glycine cleavage system transcriptional activator [Oceanibacterium hippocampi]
MSGLPPLPALRAFEAAARHLSFKRAAEELAVTPTAISHQIRLLEEVLGVRLFDRRPRQVSLSPAGVTLFPPINGAFAAMREAVGRITENKRRRGLTLSATTAFTAKWLVPRLARFAEVHPDIDLRLHASDEIVNFGAGGADVAVRYGPGPFPDLSSEPLFEEHFAPMCSPQLGVRSPEDLKRQTLLHSEWRKVDSLTPSWARWCEEAGLEGPDTTIGPVFLDDSHLIQATVASQGVALLSPILVSEELSAGYLVQPFGPELPGYAYHLVHPPSSDSAVEIEALKNWMKNALNR